VTAPTENRLEVDTKPCDRPRTTTMTSDIAVEQPVRLLNEVVAKGALPAL
jgi:hypothetical protein